MYLTRMALNTARRDALKVIGSPYKMHAAVESAFPPSAIRRNEEGRILWRLDALSDGEGAWLYVVSPERPDLTHLAEQAGWPLYPEWETKEYDPFLCSLEVGQTWAFRLCANPVRKVLVDQGKRPNDCVVGKVMGHVTAEQQRRWLLDRSERYGFQIACRDGSPSLVISDRAQKSFLRDGKRVTMATARFDGVLTVTDSDLLRNALCFGIGKGKSFGCGLLTLASSGSVQ